MKPNPFQIPFQPVAQLDAVVLAPHVRFTILTPQLLRLEYSPIGQFEDRASQVFWYRQQPVPKYEVVRTVDGLIITTGHLRLAYRVTRHGFAPETLSIEVKATGRTWKYGDAGNRDNLRGTARTLDEANGAVPLERGLMSRAGWSVVDDSRSPVFNEQSWLEARADTGNIDLYFFGYGHDYVQCLHDFCRVAGSVPLIPRYILGNWWSRYWEYSQQDLIELVTDFRQHEIPLSVCIVDMDWHVTQTGNDASGWTGYTWNRDLFPEPQRFIAWLHEQGLKTALNLHPADGVYPHEERYEQMAQFMGVDPASQQPIRFDIADPQFMHAYFEILHHPYEAMGVDFWWIDWQQGTRSKLAGLDPLMALNHLHFYDLGRDGSKRPLIFSRWFGLGNHRYPIGFSGDSVVSWESLTFQPYFTATAANVAFGWWSHDIGGHMLGVEDGELLARWVQFGVFSPILRLHSTKNPYQDRRPWAFDAETLRVIREAMQLRHALIPYLYTMAWRNHTEDMPLITPMYYSYPDEEQAYRCPHQYIFGTQLIVAPYTTPIDPDTRLSRQQVWLPRGAWYDFFTGERFQGDRWITVYGALDEIPVFAREGAIVPLAPKVDWGGVENPDELELYVFPEAQGGFDLYEDDGETLGYRQGQFRETGFGQNWRDSEAKFTIAVKQGDRTVTPQWRTYRLVLRGVNRPERCEVRINGVERETRSNYDEVQGTFVIEKLVVNVADVVEIILTKHAGPLSARIDRRTAKCRRMLRTFRMESALKQEIDENLADLFKDVGLLKSFGAGVKDAHITALRSVIEDPDR